MAVTVCKLALAPWAAWQQIVLISYCNKTENKSNLNLTFYLFGKTTEDNIKNVSVKVSLHW